MWKSPEPFGLKSKNFCIYNAKYSFDICSREDKWSCFNLSAVHTFLLVSVLGRNPDSPAEIRVCLTSCNCAAGSTPDTISSSILTVLMMATEDQEDSRAGSLPCMVSKYVLMVWRGTGRWCCGLFSFFFFFWFGFFKRRNLVLLFCWGKCRPSVNVFCLPDSC